MAIKWSQIPVVDKAMCLDDDITTPVFDMRQMLWGSTRIVNRIDFHLEREWRCLKRRKYDFETSPWENSLTSTPSWWCEMESTSVESSSETPIELITPPYKQITSSRKTSLRDTVDSERLSTASRQQSTIKLKHKSKSPQISESKIRKENQSKQHKPKTVLQSNRPALSSMLRSIFSENDGSSSSLPTAELFKNIFNSPNEGVVEEKGTYCCLESANVDLFTSQKLISTSTITTEGREITSNSRMVIECLTGNKSSSSTPTVEKCIFDSRSCSMRHSNSERDYFSILKTVFEQAPNDQKQRLLSEVRTFANLNNLSVTVDLPNASSSCLSTETVSLCQKETPDFVCNRNHRIDNSLSDQINNVRSVSRVGTADVDSLFMES